MPCQVIPLKQDHNKEIIKNNHILTHKYINYNDTMEYDIYIHKFTPQNRTYVSIFFQSLKHFQQMDFEQKINLSDDCIWDTVSDKKIDRCFCFFVSLFHAYCEIAQRCLFLIFYFFFFGHKKEGTMTPHTHTHTHTHTKKIKLKKKLSFYMFYIRASNQANGH